MSVNETGQITHDAAEVYEEFFVPVLFQQFVEPMMNAAGVRAGQRVLDVACGTGVLARAVAERTGATGAVTGLDLNPGMLAVARRVAPAIEWKQGRAEALPFEDQSFDAVVCQFGLMFFEDRPAALREMLRVLRPGGRLAVAVWDAIDRSPGYAAEEQLLLRLFGEQVVESIRAPFVLGDLAVLNALLAEAGIRDAVITPQSGTARYPSVEAMMYTEIKGWTLAGELDDEQYELLLREAEQVFQPFTAIDGSVAFDSPAHIVTATK